MRMSLIGINNGIPKPHTQTFSRVLDLQIAFGKWLNRIDLHWELVAKDSTQVVMEVFCNYHNRLILVCQGTPEVIQEIGVMITEEPKMFNQ